MHNNDLAISMYHYVRDFSKTAYPKINGLDTKKFENQIKYFSKYYKVLTMEEVLHHYETKTSLPSKSMLLTFDDGYTDHYLEVLPILKKYQMQGTFFVPSRAIDKKEVLDVNKIHFLMAVLDEDFFVKEIFSFIDSHRAEHDLKTNEQYFLMYKDLGYHLDSASARFIKKILQMGLPEMLRKKAVKELFRKHFPKNEEDFSSELYLSKKQIGEMLSEKMHIGSHAHSHL
ncbi:MAG: polysaccharide deacetylase family protein [Bdellovibrionales bacterium]|nr:polysaccharide deacetylase family protein [Bdellovibrionales bacterium]